MASGFAVVVLIVDKCVSHKMYNFSPFKMSTSLALSTFKSLCNHWHPSAPKLLSSCKTETTLTKQSPVSSPLSYRHSLCFCEDDCLRFLLWVGSCSWYVFFSDWLVSFSKISPRPIIQCRILHQRVLPFSGWIRSFDHHTVLNPFARVVAASPSESHEHFHCSLHRRPCISKERCSVLLPWVGILSLQSRNPLTYKKHEQSVLWWACDRTDVESESLFRNENRSVCWLGEMNYLGRVPQIQGSGLRF